MYKCRWYSCQVNFIYCEVYFDTFNSDNNEFDYFKNRLSQLR